MEDEVLVLLLIEQMCESGLVYSYYGWLYLLEYKVGFIDEQQVVWYKVEILFGDDLWWVCDFVCEVYVEELLMCVVLCQVVQQGMIIVIVKDCYYCNDCIVQFVQWVCELDWLCGLICVVDFCDILNVGWKLVIQILEYFDWIGFICCCGNDYILCDKVLFW